jgi:hypothetical protein
MPPSPYWFPAKSYGWGWGPPTCWQRWAVLVAVLPLRQVMQAPHRLVEHQPLGVP